MKLSTTLTIKEVLEKIPDPVFEISRRLKDNGYKSYLVGGSLRDLILKKSPHDFDIGTDAIPSVLLDIFPKSLEVGAKFGTIIVLSSELGLEDNTGELEEFQVTTFRKDAKYINGRWPTSVEFSKTIEEDLSRRDFSINAMALDISENFNDVNVTVSSIIIDPYEGMKDLQKAIIKGVGDPYERIKEDGLRAFRACRLASQLEFVIEDETFNAVKGAKGTAEMISIERIRDEFLKILGTQTPSIGIELMRRAGLLEKFIPELLEGVGMEQNQFHAHDLYTHLLRTCDVAEKRIRLAALLHDIGKSRTKDGEHFYNHEEVGALMAQHILNRLKIPKIQANHIVKLIRLHMFNYQKSWKDSAVRRFLRRVGDDETLKDLFLLRIADSVSNPKSEYDPSELKDIEERIEKIKEEDNALHVKDLKINGYDIQNLGVTNGPFIGRILETLLEMVLDDPYLNRKEKLIKKANEIIKQYN